MKRILVTIFVFGIFVAGMVACSAGSNAPVIRESPTPTGAAIPSQASAAIPFPEMAGLDQLNSYTLSLRVSFKGTQDGQAQDTADTYTRMFSRDTATQFTIIQTTDDNGKSITYMRGWVGDVLYMRTGLDEPCSARIVPSADRQTFDPAVLIKPFTQGKEIGLETVNGVSTRHYGTNAQGANSQMNGEVWIAESLGYIIKYSMSIKGGEEYFGKGIIGEKTISFEVSDAGANKPVPLPVGCPPPITNIPAMPDAANLERSLSQLSYTSTASIDNTVAFYKDQMKLLGWDLDSSSIPSNTAQLPPGLEQLPNLSIILTQVPGGVDLNKYIPTAIPVEGAPVNQEGWMIFVQAQEQKTAYILLRPEGTNLRVQIQIQQD